jgi:hypothetical protein
LGKILKLWENRCLIIFPINILKLENFRVLQVPLSTGGDGAKLEHVDEGFHEGILLTG